MVQIPEAPGIVVNKRWGMAARLRHIIGIARLRDWFPNCLRYVKLNRSGRLAKLAQALRGAGRDIKGLPGSPGLVPDGVFEGVVR